MAPTTHYVESCLDVYLPDRQHFRFADLPSYQKLKGQNLKEMDFALVSGGKLYLLEVRSYQQLVDDLAGSDFVPAKGRATPYRYLTLARKVTDSLMMLMAAWAGSPSGCGPAIRGDLPVCAASSLQVILTIAVDLPKHLTPHLSALRSSLNASLRGRMALAGVESVAVIDYQTLVGDPLFGQFIRLQRG